MYIPYAAPAASMQALGNTCLVVLPSHWQFSNRCAQHTYHDMHNRRLQMGIWQRLILQVNPKRHNVPGMKERGRGRGRGPPRGRGFFPRGRGRGAFYGGFDPSFGYGGYGGGYGYDLMSTGLYASTCVVELLVCKMPWLACATMISKQCPRMHCLYTLCIQLDL